MADSTQHWLDRNRPPRVQITYDLETLGAIEKVEIPFVVGIMSHLSGDLKDAPPPLKKRKFVNIDRDNFVDVMKAIAPRLAFQVDNRLANDGSKLNVELAYDTSEKAPNPGMGFFDPIEIVRQVPALAALYGARQSLRDLLTKLDGNDELDLLLQDAAKDTAGLTAIKGAIAPPPPATA
ncbi:MAG: type VI secretion system contractile sheath small subunit [Gemmatimonadales bacterium]|nr:type VI secretion system contractile sheath small subunit [Gemmatimonadales bacterium]